ncbi:precorrin-2 C(20)-methyltransferase [Desulfovibrio sp. OttesenSCG-928-A18]|nr:precorrin-2 C(20)-methyltransferase [Desulfovibrio sp. OttesenSCG-928-A18]
MVKQNNIGQKSSPRPDAQGPGILYGVGVGPGDPELLTLRAERILKSVPVILAAASPRNEDSLALSIAAPHLPDGVETLRLDFPMTRDAAVLAAAWRENAEKTAAVLRSGRNAAFLTLGDPLIYSTFGYLMRGLQECMPQARVEAVSGITSFQAAAARAKTVLCEGEENLLLISGINGRERLSRAMACSDCAVVLKAYKNMDQIRQALLQSGRTQDIIFASKIGMQGEVLERGFASIPDKPAYLSLLLAPPERGGCASARDPAKGAQSLLNPSKGHDAT